MKKLMLMLGLVAMSMSAFAQDADQVFKKDEVSGDYYYEEVVQVPGVKKEVMYDRAKKWVIANFKTADNNIKFDDAEFSIVNSAAIKIDKRMFTGIDIKDGAYDFKLHLWFKDDKYKVRVDNMMFYVLVLRSGMGREKEGTQQETLSFGNLEDKKWHNYLKKQSGEKTISVLNVLKSSVMSDESQKKSDW